MEEDKKSKELFRKLINEGNFISLEEFKKEIEQRYPSKNKYGFE